MLLETDRLILRQFTEDDVDNLIALNSDPDVVRFTADREVDRSVIQTQILPQWFSFYETYNGYGVWAAVEKSSQTFIGWFIFRPAVHAAYFDPALADPNDIELGYRLRKSAWGKGYATEGAKALIFKGFSELGAQRIVAPALAANVASIRVLEKSGLQLQHRFTDAKLGLEVVIYALNILTPPDH
ncbi:GNAT family N-acetyltransferase [Pantanalinema rosaneae CENA516]|uniref:GNAT family N-acetyltransferase n=1 Tax=Pantanalinema rosaneae TaxID=1620701 RepID=UPI003D701854